MTSDSTGSTAASNPCDTCPGPAGCHLTRMEPRSAYIAGCRAPIAREANTAYTRERRAQRRAQGLTGPVSEWSAPEPEPGPEPTGELCEECGEPLYWTVSRAGQVCASGHFRLPPDTAELAADTVRARKRAVSEPSEIAETRPSVIETARLDAERARIIRLCESSLAELDVSQLREIAASVPWYNHVPGWNEETAHALRAVFGSFIQQAKAARTSAELQEIDTARQTVAISGEMNTTRAMIQQEFRDTANGLTYRTQGTARFRVEPGNANRIEALPAGNPAASGATPESIAAQQWRAQPGARNISGITPLPNAYQALNAIGRAYHDPEPDDPEDDDYEDDDYEEYPRRRVIYDDNEANGNALLYVVGGILVIAAIWWGINQAGLWYRREEYHTCQNPNHTGRPALARERFDGYRESVTVCNRSQCREWGHAAVTIPGYGEPRNYPLVDAAGAPGWNAQPNGRMRKNKQFTGARK